MRGAVAKIFYVIIKKVVVDLKRTITRPDGVYTRGKGSVSTERRYFSFFDTVVVTQFGVVAKVRRGE